MKIKLEEKSKNHFRVFANTKYIGSFIRDVDGFFYFWTKEGDSDGFWSEHSLRMIADKLKEVNKEWNDFIDKNLKT